MLKLSKMFSIWLYLAFAALKPLIFAVPFEYIDDHEQLSYDLDTEQSKAKYDPRLLSEQLLKETGRAAQIISSEFNYEYGPQRQQRDQWKQKETQRDFTDDLQPHERAANCHSGGMKYTHGQKVPRVDSCEVCLCVDGEIFCWWKKCGRKKTKFTKYPGEATKSTTDKFTAMKLVPSTIQANLSAKQQNEHRNKHLKKYVAGMREQHLRKQDHEEDQEYRQTKELPLYVQTQSTNKQHNQHDYHIKKQQQNTLHISNKFLNFPENLPSLLHYDYKDEEHRHHQQHQQHIKHYNQEQQQRQQQQQQRQQQQQQRQLKEVQSQNERGTTMLLTITEEAAEESVAPAVTSKTKDATETVSKSQQEYRRDRDETEGAQDGGWTEEEVATTDSDILPEPPTKLTKLNVASAVLGKANKLPGKNITPAATTTISMTKVKAKKIPKNDENLREIQSQEGHNGRSEEEGGGEQIQEISQQQYIDAQRQEMPTIQSKNLTIDNYLSRNSTSSDGIKNDHRKTISNNENNNNNNSSSSKYINIPSDLKATAINTSGNQNVERQSTNSMNIDAVNASRFSNDTQRNKCRDNTNENNVNNNNDEKNYYNNDNDNMGENSEQDYYDDDENNDDIHIEVDTGEGEDNDFHRWLSFMKHRSNKNRKKMGKMKSSNDEGIACCENDCNSKPASKMEESREGESLGETINPYETTTNATKFLTSTTNHNINRHEKHSHSHGARPQDKPGSAGGVSTNIIVDGDAEKEMSQSSYADSSHKFNENFKNILLTARQQEKPTEQKQQQHDEQKQLNEKQSAHHQHKQNKSTNSELFVLPAALISNASRATEFAAAAAAAAAAASANNNKTNVEQVATTFTPQTTLKTTTTAKSYIPAERYTSNESSPTLKLMHHGLLSWPSTIQAQSAEPMATMLTGKQCNVMGTFYNIGEVLPQETGNCLQCVCIDGSSTKDDTPRVTCSPHNCPPLVLPDLFDATGY